MLATPWDDIELKKHGSVMPRMAWRAWLGQGKLRSPCHKMTFDTIHEGLEGGVCAASASCSRCGPCQRRDLAAQLHDGLPRHDLTLDS